jgi:hypothetical protein
LRTINSFIHAVVVCFLVCGLTGCAFDRVWSEAQQYSYPEHELAGCWEGTWQSDYNGHHGSLRAVITKQNEGVYNAHFKATFAVLIPYEFEIAFFVSHDGQIYTFEGTQDLGRLAGGVYTYNGTASSTDFRSFYSADNKDHGTFTMQKLQTCNQCGSNDCCGGRNGECGTSSEAEPIKEAAFRPAETDFISEIPLAR